jgi:hypothetical protein
LKVGADFLRRHFPEAAVWVSDPTWDNHISLFESWSRSFMRLTLPIMSMVITSLLPC